MGCKIETLAKIDQGDCPIHLPNSFSPNDDGDNDWYKIYTDASFNGKLLSFEIYNRWGNRIFFLENCKSNQNLWNGKFNGEALNMGIFPYVLKLQFDSGNTEIIQGVLTLVR